MKLFQAIVNNSAILNRTGIYASSLYTNLQDAADARQTRINNLLPSGSGFDAGVKIESANDSKIVFSTSFHHMDDTGFYCGWSEHNVIVSASLQHGFTIRCTGKNKRDIKEYIENVFGEILDLDFDWIQK